MEISPKIILILGGLLIGGMFGAIVQRTNYCIMGAVADYAISGNLLRMRAWMLSIGTAIACSQAVHLLGWVDLSSSFYRASTIPWIGLLSGGLLFGFGMVIACGCTSRSLVNFASGDLRALIALIIMAIFAYMTLNGLLAFPRVWLTSATQIDLSNYDIPGQGITTLVRLAVGIDAAWVETVVVIIICTFLFWFTLKDKDLRSEPRYLFAAAVLGLLIAAGWLTTGVLGHDEFEPVPLTSLRFVAPTGNTLQYLMTFTGAQITFGVATVIGVILGGFSSALSQGQFKYLAFEDLHDLRRYMLGGAMMGVGGVLALGCTVGQGLSGLSTLSLGSFLATGSIISGGILGVRYLESGSLAGALREIFNRG
jgi:uncharacterized membrane protein YedE/YeeE